MRQNGVYIIHGELTQLVTSMRRSARWGSSSNLDELYGPMIQNLLRLKDVLSGISDLSEIEPNVFLSPFLEVIRSDDTTGPITGLALTSISKFITYGLFGLQSASCTQAVENIADSVTHARFVGTDPGSDEVVLMKILYVLRTLVLSKVGAALTNESVCEIMQSCFRICFEIRLSELLRKSADHTLMEMVQLLFSRLPEFREDVKWATAMKKLKMRAGGSSQRSKKKRSSGGKACAGDTVHRTASADESRCASANCESLHGSEEKVSLAADSGHLTTDEQRLLPADGAELSCAVSEQHCVATSSQMSESSGQHDGSALSCEVDASASANSDVCGSSSLKSVTATSNFDLSNDTAGKPGIVERHCAGDPRLDEDNEDASSSENEDITGLFSFDASHYNHFVNPKGVRFVPTQRKEGSGPLVPYGLPCIRELFRFLISIMNPADKHNTDVMMHMGLNLLTVALETAADDIPRYASLLSFARDEMCLHLYRLLNSERFGLFTAAHRLWFLAIESMRGHLKLQLEAYLLKLMEVISAPEGIRISQEQREIALEAAVGLWKIPGLSTELFINYDCDLYCANIFEDFTKLLSKNAFPVTGLFNVHLLALDALLAIVDSIEQHCQFRILEANDSPLAVLRGIRDGLSTGGNENAPAASSANDYPKSTASRAMLSVRPNRMGISANVPTLENLREARSKKKILLHAIEQFNTKAAKGIACMQDGGLLTSQPDDVARFLRETPRLSKAQIGEYIANKKHKEVFEAFVATFDFAGKRLDESLRMFLETFRLPGESPVIEYLMEHFSRYWQESNGNPFANADAAFTLTYAVIMLNVDQHNKNAKKQNVPMTVEDFKRNLKKCNGNNDFDAEMLEQIYHAIRTNEIVMPDEQTGVVKENYMWKVIMAKCVAGEASYIHAATGTFDSEIFALVWGPTVAALSFVFDKSADVEIMQRALNGFKKCAVIAAHYAMSEVFDNLVISLCKFTTLLGVTEPPDRISVLFGSNGKAQMAAKAVFSLGHSHADILRDGWKNILDCFLTLYRARLLPSVLTEVEDFVKRDGKLRLIREDKREPSSAPRSDAGFMSSILSYISSSDVGGNASAGSRGSSGAVLTSEEQRSIEIARSCIDECAVDTLVDDTKFLRVESLLEFIKALVEAAHVPAGGYDDLAPPASPLVIIGDAEEELAIFSLELLVRVVLQNRDRASVVWSVVRDHLSMLILHATEPNFFVERAVTGLLRIAIRLLCREEVASQIIPTLRILLAMRASVLRSLARPIIFGLHRLLETNAANIHSADDWQVLFTLLSVFGAGATPPRTVVDEVLLSTITTKERALNGGTLSDTEQPSLTTFEDSDRGYTSDSDLVSYAANLNTPTSPTAPSRPMSVAGHSSSEWTTVKRHHQRSHQCDYPDGSVTAAPRCQTDASHSCSHSAAGHGSLLVNQFSIDLGEELHLHDSQALLRAAESLSLLVRDAAHITPYNFEICVHTLRVFVQASMGGMAGSTTKKASAPSAVLSKADAGKGRHKKKAAHVSSKMPRSRTAPSLGSSGRHSDDDDDEMTNEALTSAYNQLPTQLLELIHTLHTRAASIFGSWAEEQQLQNDAERSSMPLPSDVSGTAIDAGASSLWNKCWCPLLQGIAQLCCDARKQVRSHALMYLQRALLVQDLNQLSAAEWELCFNRVLFPLLAILLEKSPTSAGPQQASGIAIDSASLEETRMRASTLLSKVFLQHLHPLLSLSTFTALWLTILDFMRKYMHADKSDLLLEAIPESLKNMLRVMNTAGIFQEREINGDESPLWKLTWECIDTFLPTLKSELFPPPEEAKADVPILDDGSVGSLGLTQNEDPQVSGGVLQTSLLPSQTASSVLSATITAAEPIPIVTTAGVFAAEVATATDQVAPPSIESRPSSPLMEQPSLSASAFVQLHPPLDPTAVAAAAPLLVPPASSPCVTDLTPPQPGTRLGSSTTLATSTQRSAHSATAASAVLPVPFQGFTPPAYTSMSLLLDPTLMQGSSVAPFFAVPPTTGADQTVKFHISSCKGSEI